MCFLCFMHEYITKMLFFFPLEEQMKELSRINMILHVPFNLLIVVVCNEIYWYFVCCCVVFGTLMLVLNFNIFYSYIFITYTCVVFAGVYKLIPFYKGENTVFDVSPPFLFVSVQHEHATVPQKFQVHFL